MRASTTPHERAASCGPGCSAAGAARGAAGGEPRAATGSHRHEQPGRLGGGGSPELQRLPGDQDLRIDFGVERQDLGDRHPGLVGDRGQGVARFDGVGLAPWCGASFPSAAGPCRAASSSTSRSPIAAETTTTTATTATIRAKAAAMRAAALERFSIGRGRADRWGRADRSRVGRSQAVDISQTATRRRSAAAAGSGSAAMPREAATRPAARPGRESGPEQLGLAALGADAGDEEDRPRHQLAHAGEVAGLGGADDRAHPAQPTLAGQALGELGDDGGEPLVQRLLGRGQVLQVGGPGVAGADQGEDPRPASAAAATSGSSASRPSSGLAVKASASSPATGPQGVGVSPTRACA